MPRRKSVSLVSDRQWEILLAYMESNPDLAKGSIINESPLAKREAARRWDELALSLNSVWAGATKTGSKWRGYWNVKKYAAKKRASEHRQRLEATGGEALDSKPVELTVAEEHILALIGDASVRIPFTASPSPLHFKVEPLSPPPPFAASPPAASPPAASPPADDDGALDPSPANLDFAGQADALGERGSRRRQYQHRVAEVPEWVFRLEERRIAIEEHTFQMLQSLAVTQRYLAASKVQVAASQAAIAESQAQVAVNLSHVRETLKAMRP